MTPTLTSTCVNETRVWTVLSNNTGEHVVEFLVGGNAQSTGVINLVAGVPATFTFSGDATTLSGVRVTFNGSEVASESGPYESCAPPPPPSGELSSLCINNVRVWTVAVEQSGDYVAVFIVNNTPVATIPLVLTAGVPQTFTFAGDATQLDSVRITFAGREVATESGPYESCTGGDTPSVTLTPVCTDSGLLWRVTASKSGSYLAQIISGGSVIETVNLTLTENTPQTFSFLADSTTPNSVRIVYQNTLVVLVEGPESCVSGLSAALAPACTRLGVEWTVITNRTGQYVAQLMLGETVIESLDLNLTESVDQTFIFQADSTSPRFARLVYQGSEYARQNGLPTECSPTSLPPTDEPTMTNFIFLPTVSR